MSDPPPLSVVCHPIALILRKPYDLGPFQFPLLVHSIDIVYLNSSVCL